MTPGHRRRPWRSDREPWQSLLLGIASIVAVGLVVAGCGGSSDGSAARGGRTGGDFHSLVVDPVDPERIFVGGHQAVSVSDDGGLTWTEIGPLRDADAMGWAFTSDHIYVSGHPGLTRSDDDGNSFDRASDGLPTTDVHALGGSGTTLYGAGPGGGFFAGNPDIGWEQRNADIGHSFFGRILVDPDDPDRLFAADAQAGVARSTDGGRTWELLDAPITSAVWLSTPDTSPETIIASGPDGVAVSPDTGQTWNLIQTPEGTSLVEAVPGRPGHLYAGQHQGEHVELWTSTDGGDTWAKQ